MPKISSRITFDKRAAIAQIRAASNKALTIMGDQALTDITRHVPKDQGLLQDSGIINSDRAAHDLKFILRWDTPYAQYLWHGKVMHGNPTKRTYGLERISFTSALAREEWAKYAKEVYGEEWKQVLQNALRMELKD